MPRPVRPRNISICPATGAHGPGFEESRFVVPELLVRFDHARGVAEVLIGPRSILGACRAILATEQHVATNALIGVSP